MTFAWKQAGLSYNKFLSVASRTVRRSLKEEPRLAAEKRGLMELRFSKWQGGKQQPMENLGEANEAAFAQQAGKESTS